MRDEVTLKLKSLLLDHANARKTDVAVQKEDEIFRLFDSMRDELNARIVHLEQNTYACEFNAQVRTAVADYMASARGGAPIQPRRFLISLERLAQLLEVPRNEYGPGYNFSKFCSSDEQPDGGIE